MRWWSCLRQPHLEHRSVGRAIMSPPVWFHSHHTCHSISRRFWHQMYAARICGRICSLYEAFLRSWQNECGHTEPTSCVCGVSGYLQSGLHFIVFLSPSMGTLCGVLQSRNPSNSNRNPDKDAAPRLWPCSLVWHHTSRTALFFVPPVLYTLTFYVCAISRILCVDHNKTVTILVIVIFFAVATYAEHYSSASSAPHVQLGTREQSWAP